MARIKDYEEEGTNVLTLCIATLVVVAVIFSVIMMMAIVSRLANIIACDEFESILLILKNPFAGRPSLISACILLSMLSVLNRLNTKTLKSAVHSVRSTKGSLAITFQ